jgi:hypothetical protein
MGSNLQDPNGRAPPGRQFCSAFYFLTILKTVMKSFLITVFTVACIFSCSPKAQIQSSWRDPDARVDMSKVKKVLVLALFQNEANRRYAETKLTNLLGNRGVASFRYFAEVAGPLRINDLEKKLKREGFEGAVIMRLADVDKDITYTPGSYGTYPAYYGRFGPYVQASWNYYAQPGHYETTRTFTIETNVYSLVKDKLVWSSLTSSANPQSASKLMDAVAKEVYQQMKKEGFLVND